MYPVLLSYVAHIISIVRDVCGFLLTLSEEVLTKDLLAAHKGIFKQLRVKWFFLTS